MSDFTEKEYSFEAPFTSDCVSKVKSVIYPDFVKNTFLLKPVSIRLKSASKVLIMNTSVGSKVLGFLRFNSITTVYSFSIYLVVANVIVFLSFVHPLHFY